MSTRKAVEDAIAESSAHGISRAVGSRSRKLKAMWTILFLVFLVLCCKSAWNMVNRLINITVMKTYESDAVSFEIPDFYFCPNLIYSGSIPYTLAESEVKIINDEVERLGKLYDRLYCSNGTDFCTRGEEATFRRVARIQLSMPVRILNRNLLQQENQSFLVWPYLLYQSYTEDIDYAYRSVFIHPDNSICFKVRVLEENLENLYYKRAVLYTMPFVDPYVPEFHYSGAEIKPIVNPWLNESIPFQYWQANDRYHSMESLGFTLQIVPKDTYPSMIHETKLSLSAGRSYRISIGMEETVHSPELHGKYCKPEQETAVFQNQLTGARQEFKSSRGACFFTRMNFLLQEKFKFVFSMYPKPWSLRDIPRFENMTEIEMQNISVANLSLPKVREFIDNRTQDVVNECRKQQPCVYSEYSVTSTSVKWPRPSQTLALQLVREYDKDIGMLAHPEYSPSGRPATMQLVELSRRILSGNCTAHEKFLFSHFVQESMIEVKIETQSHISPRILIAYSYSWVAFLADIGGLLGLYIGCSLLTVCELFELAYHLLSGVAAARAARRSRGLSKDPNAVSAATEDAGREDCACANETNAAPDV